MHLALGGSVYGCVRWVGMPSLPEGTANDTALYGASGKLWGANVARARKLVREPNVGFDWRLAKCSHVRPAAPPYCTYGLGAPASCVPHVPKAQGSLLWGGHTLCTCLTLTLTCVRASLGRTVAPQAAGGHGGRAARALQ